MNIAIIFTGIVYDYCVNDLIRYYNDCKYTKIVSTWNHIDKTLIDKLKDNNFIIIQSDFPDDMKKCSVNYQNYSTLMGIQKAKELGITHIIRVRSDMYTNNINKLLDIYKSIYEANKMIFLIKFNHDGGYLIDYAYFGDVLSCENRVNKFQSHGDNRFPEKFCQEEQYKTTDQDKICKDIIFSIHLLIKNDVGFYFLKDEYTCQGNVLLRYI